MENYVPEFSWVVLRGTTHITDVPAGGSNFKTLIVGDFGACDCSDAFSAFHGS